MYQLEIDVKAVDLQLLCICMNQVPPLPEVTARMCMVVKSLLYSWCQKEICDNSKLNL